MTRIAKNVKNKYSPKKKYPIDASLTDTLSPSPSPIRNINPITPEKKYSKMKNPNTVRTIATIGRPKTKKSTFFDFQRNFLTFATLSPPQDKNENENNETSAKLKYSFSFHRLAQHIICNRIINIFSYA